MRFRIATEDHCAHTKFEEKVDPRPMVIVAVVVVAVNASGEYIVWANLRRQRAIDETRRRTVREGEKQRERETERGGGRKGEHCARTFEGKQATINSGFVVVAQRAARGDFEWPQFGEHPARVYARVYIRGAREREHETQHGV